MSCCWKRKRSEKLSRRESRTKKPGSKSATTDFNLCLMGIDGSGKSTFIRQMTFIHGNGFDDQEMDEFKQIVFDNILDAMTILYHRMSSLGIALASSDKQNDVVKFLSQDSTLEERLRATRSLWADEGIQECFRRANEYAPESRLEVSTQYFMEALDRILEPGYIPITEDIIRVRRPTQGITDHTFEVKNCFFRIKDLGGEKEWESAQRIIFEESFTSIIFLAAMDEYDTYCYVKEEDKYVKKNRLQLSLTKFKQLLALQLPQTSYILFLNKQDIFSDKIKTSPLSQHFPQYKGGTDENRAKNFILDMFHEGMSKKVIFSRFTTATDRDNMRIVFESVKNTILQIHIDNIIYF